MKLTKLCKDTASGSDGCPTVYVADDGSVVVQGDELAPTDRDLLENRLPGETGVAIRPELLLQAADLYRARRG